MSPLLAHLIARDQRRRHFTLALIAAALVVSVFLDAPLYHLMLTDDRPRLERRDWYQMFDLLGYLPVWFNVAGCLMLHRAWHRRQFPEAYLPRPSGLRPFHHPLGGAYGLVATSAWAGGVASILKAVVGRERPGYDGEYLWKPLFQGFVDGKDLGFPSSHAAVAFGAAFALARMFPGTGVVVVPLAVGCGVARMLVGAHFLSDVVGAAALAWVTVNLVVPRPRTLV